VVGQVTVIHDLADVAPAGTVTEGATGASAGSELVSCTTAPPGGAGAVMDIVAVLVFPPTR
jgi:hypothetical protein